MLLQVFTPAANTLARASLLLLALLLLLLAVGAHGFVRSSWATGEDLLIEQPVQFSHAHHVGGIGLDCRLCHAHADRGPVAGLPTVEVCMTCHREVWADAPILAPVRAAWRAGREIEWNRVHDLADYVYFHHGIHAAGGIGCETCHGRVDTMALMRQDAPLTMTWCLDCHRDPAAHVRPLDEVFTMGWQPPEGFDRAVLAAELGLERHTDCTACHR